MARSEKDYETSENGEKMTNTIQTQVEKIIEFAADTRKRKDDIVRDYAYFLYLFCKNVALGGARDSEAENKFKKLSIMFLEQEISLEQFKKNNREFFIRCSGSMK